MGIGQLTRIARNLFRFDQELIKQEAIEQDRAFVTYYVVDLAADATTNIAITNPTSDDHAMRRRPSPRILLPVAG